MYASSACELVFRVDPDKMVGKPFLLYIRADDLAPFVEQMNLVGSTDTITHMRFWFQSPNWPREIPCEAMLCGAADGMIAVVRRCKPFVRRHLIRDSDHIESKSQNPLRPLNDSKTWMTTPPIIPTLSPPLTAARPSRQKLTRSILNRIKVMELDDDDKIRPLTDIASDDPRLVQYVSLLPEGYQIKENYIQEYEEDNDDDNDDNDDGGNNVEPVLGGHCHKENDTITHDTSYRECF